VYKDFQTADINSSAISDAASPRQVDAVPVPSFGKEKYNF